MKTFVVTFDSIFRQPVKVRAETFDVVMGKITFKANNKAVGFFWSGDVKSIHEDTDEEVINTEST